MTRPHRFDTLGGRHHEVARRTGDEERKPNLRGFKIYIGDFVAPEDPGNDPQDLTATPPIDTSPSSPPYQNGLTYMAGAPVWFAHGLDGETDMGGMYDVVTGGYVSGDLGFEMPLEWAAQAPTYHDFVLKLDDGVFTIAVQEITLTLTVGEVRIWFPIVAEPIVP